MKPPIPFAPILRRWSAKLADAPRKAILTPMWSRYSRIGWIMRQANRAKSMGKNTISVSIELAGWQADAGLFPHPVMKKGKKHKHQFFSYSGFRRRLEYRKLFLYGMTRNSGREMENPRYEEIDDVGYKNDLIRQRGICLTPGWRGMQKNNMDLRAAADKAVRLLEETGH